MTDGLRDARTTIMSSPSELRDRAAKLEEEAAALRADADQMELTELAKDPTAFFQVGHTYQSMHIRLGPGSYLGESVWTFRCEEVARRRNREVIANGVTYWGRSDGQVVKGTSGRSTYTAEFWLQGWTDITEAKEQQ